MDEAGLDRGLHLEALDALGRVNRVSLTARRAWREIERLWVGGARPVRVLDVACGGGDVLIDLARRAQRRGVSVELVGCDVSDVALERARRSCASYGEAKPSFEKTDVLAGPLRGGNDLVLCTLFLHHLSEADAVRLLRSMAASSEQVLLVQDLRRTRSGYALAWLGLHSLTRSIVARRDGLRSVRAAFALQEVTDLARRASLPGADVRSCWPQRFTLRWVRGPTTP